jgi:hypothetical protein
MWTFGILAAGAVLLALTACSPSPSESTADAATGYQAQAALGGNAYSITGTGTGFVNLFFVRGQSEMQINVSALQETSEEQIQQTIALAHAL